MVTITLYMRQQKRHWCIEQSFGLCGKGRGWNDLGEWHWNMYNIMDEMSHQSRFNAGYWMLGAGALGWPRGMVWGGRREEGPGWGTHVYLWQIHFDIWQNQYNIIKLNKIKLKKKRERFRAYIRVKVLVAEPCLTLWNTMDCLLGSSVHRILQAGILEWVAVSFSRGPFWSRDRTQASWIASRLFTVWATRDAQEKHLLILTNSSL